MVSIRDIAKKAGVSVTSVSYALNGNPKVSKKTTEHIKQVARELNYRPNAAARTLKTRLTKKIGIFIREDRGIFFGDILSGVIETCSKFGYDVVVCTGEKALDSLDNGSVDGGLVMDNRITSEEVMRLADAGRKLVVLDRTFYHKHVRQVLLDNENGMKQMIQHLVDLPTQTTYLVTGSNQNFDNQIRSKAALATFSDLAPNREISVLEGDFRLNGGLEAAKIIEREWNGEPTTVLALSDSPAIGMQKYFQKKGFVIGKDILLAGFDNSLLSQYVTPPLTTVDYSTELWGNIAAKVLLQLVQSDDTHDELIPTSLKIRTSTTG